MLALLRKMTWKFLQTLKFFSHFNISFCDFFQFSTNFPPLCTTFSNHNHRNLAVFAFLKAFDLIFSLKLSRLKDREVFTEWKFRQVWGKHTARVCVVLGNSYGGGADCMQAEGLCSRLWSFSRTCKLITVLFKLELILPIYIKLLHEKLSVHFQIFAEIEPNWPHLTQFRKSLLKCI